MLLTRPGALTGSQQVLLGKLTAACPKITSLASLVGDFAALLRREPAIRGRQAVHLEPRSWACPSKPVRPIS